MDCAQISTRLFYWKKKLVRNTLRSTPSERKVSGAPPPRVTLLVVVLFSFHPYPKCGYAALTVPFYRRRATHCVSPPQPSSRQEAGHGGTPRRAVLRVTHAGKRDPADRWHSPNIRHPASSVWLGISPTLRLLEKVKTQPSEIEDCALIAPALIRRSDQFHDVAFRGLVAFDIRRRHAQR